MNKTAVPRPKRIKRIKLQKKAMRKIEKLIKGKK